MAEPPTDQRLSPEGSLRLDQLRHRFLAHCQAGQPPRLEDYLGNLTGEARGQALRELLTVEVQCRRARHEAPAPEEYHRRFPECADSIAAAFAAEPGSLETSAAAWTADQTPAAPAGLCIRCPHCLSRSPLPDGTPLDGMSCPSCGQKLGLLMEQPPGAPGIASAEAPTTIGHFRLLQRLGAGGFGAVWKAHDTQLDRVVALKIPHKGRLGPAETEKFLREARAAAQLRHPNIVSVHEVGLEGGLIYIVSDFIEGGGLDDRLAKGRPAHRDSARLCATIAHALHHAHEHGIVHRDLKPSNILMDGAGQPHIADFGLAKREMGEVTMTMDGQILGTPAYMSPEQATGKAHAADRRTDVYSMGVMLFELLTGERPFRGSMQMLLRQVVEDEPPAPRKLDGRIPRDLETICLKCLQKEPARRYPTAEALSDELERFLAGRPIQARPVGTVERFARWCRRNPWLAGSAAAALFGLLFGLIAATAGYIQTAVALEETRRAQQKDKTSLRRALRAIDDLYTQMSEGPLLNEPGMQPLRRKLLREARKHYEEFLAEYGDDESIRDELALAHFHVGRISEAIESPAKALASYENARQMQEALATANPDDVQRLRAWGDTLNAIGECMYKQQRLERALEALLQAAERRERAVALSPEDEYQRILANTYMNIGCVAQHRDAVQARHWMEKAQKIRAELLAAGCTEAKLRRDFAMGYYNLANLAVAAQDFPAAEKNSEKARGLFEALAAADPADMSAAYHVASCCGIEGDMKSHRALWEEGLARYNQACGVLESLAEKNPQVPAYRVNLAKVYLKMAQAEWDRAERDQDPRQAAMPWFERAEKLLGPLVADNVTNTRYRSDLILALTAVGKWHPEPQRRAAALKSLEALRQLLLQIHQNVPDAEGVAEHLKLLKAAIEDLRSAVPTSP